MTSNNYKSLFVLLLGETNAGKSTLVNQIIKAKVSIVSHKVQTTRFKVLGIYTEGDTQISFIDTPGIFKPKRNFDEAMVNLSYSQIEEADEVIFLIDAQKGITEHTHEIIAKLPDKSSSVAVINKIDLIKKEDLIPILNYLQNSGKFSNFFMISALKNDGVKDLLIYLKKQAKEGVWFFEEDQISDIPLQLLAAEITREKIYKFLNQELPYNIIVKPLSWEETEDKIVIYQDIFVTKDTHKRMIIGKSGEKIKSIRIASSKELEHELEKRVNLFLYVKVDEKLFLRNQTYTDIGLTLK